MRWYSARVDDNEDPDQLFGLKLVVPDLYDDNVTPMWVRPISPRSVYTVPPIDSIVIVVERAEQLRWIGVEPGGVNKPPPDAVEAYGRRTCLFSPEAAAGLVLEDGEGEGGTPIAGLFGGEVRLASSMTASVEPPVLGDSFLADYQTFREGIATFLTACKAATIEATLAAAATAASAAIASVVSPGGDIAGYKAGVARVE